MISFNNFSIVNFSIIYITRTIIFEKNKINYEILVSVKFEHLLRIVQFLKIFWISEKKNLVNRITVFDPLKNAHDLNGNITLGIFQKTKSQFPFVLSVENFSCCPFFPSLCRIFRFVFHFSLFYFFIRLPTFPFLFPSLPFICFSLLFVRKQCK